MMTVGEMSSTTIDHCVKYSNPNRQELSSVFNFHHLKVDYPDGENILQLLISKNTPGINKSGYRNPEFDALYEKLRITRDTAEKSFLMNKMIDLVMLDIPWIPLMYESSYVMIYKNVKNYRKSSINRNYVKYLKIKSE